MRQLSTLIALLIALSACSTTATNPSTGLFRATDGSLVELHVSPDQQIRGYLREGSRVAALSSVRRSGSTVNASAVYDDGARTDARGLLKRIQPPITTTNDILELTTRGDEAIATVRQKFTRQIIVEGQTHAVHTEVTQRETWRKTAGGWKLTFVDEVRDHVRFQDGQRIPTP